MKNKPSKKFIIIFVCLLVVVYVGLRVCKSNGSYINTETAVYMDASESIKADSYFIRDEVLVENNNQGVVVYNIDDAQKVSMNGNIADIYSNAQDASVRREIAYIDGQISDLERLNVSANAIVSINPTTINKQTLTALKNFIKNSNNADYYNIKQDKKDIQYLLNQRYMMIDKVNNFDNKIKELQNKKNELIRNSNGKIQSICSPAAGYFVSEVDGFEYSFDFNNVCSILPEDLLDNNVKKSDVGSNYIGKVIKGINWYIACSVSYDDALKIRVDDNITIQLPFSSSVKIPCRVVCVNKKDIDSTATVILECNYMNKDLALTRNETIYLNINDYRGIMVSKHALHENTLQKSFTDENGVESIIEKKVQGVYVLYGNKLQFRQIAPLYYGDTYVICDPKPDLNQFFTKDTVNLYDRVIVGGTDLYDGKVVKG